MLRGVVSAVLVVGVAAATVTLADEWPDGDKQAKNKGKFKGKTKGDGEEKADADKSRWQPLPPGMDSRVKEVLTDLRGQFNLMDADVSWALDADELARGFRGPDATAPEWAAGASASSEAVRGRPTQDVVKQKFPDQYFLSTYDLDRDGKVTKDEFVEGFMKPVAQHFREVFEKKDRIDAIALKLQAKGIDRAQKAKLAADMKILDANLHAGIVGFKHSLWMDRVAVGNAQRRANYAWYQQYRR